MRDTPSYQKNVDLVSQDSRIAKERIQENPAEEPLNIQRLTRVRWTRPGSSGDVIARRPRGPDLVPRERTTYREAEAGQETSPEWTRVDIAVSLRNLRSFVPSVIQKELRKLHLRWWHASEGRMRTILKTVGLDEAKLNMIKPLVDTCRECRAWQRRGNKIIPSISLPTRFLDEGDCVLM